MANKARDAKRKALQLQGTLNSRPDDVTHSLFGTNEFFDPDNVAGRKQLHDLAMMALDDLFTWFDDGGEVGIYDATNSTRTRRRIVEERCRERGIPVVFIESL